jgi:hypothetical protein
VRSTVVDYLCSSMLRRRLLSGSTWALGGKSGAAMIGLVTNGVLTRLLTKQEFGIFRRLLVGIQHYLARRGDRVFRTA